MSYGAATSGAWCPGNGRHRRTRRPSHHVLTGLLCALAVIGHAGAAPAAELDPATVAIARQAWPGSPCEGREQILYAPYLGANALGPITGAADVNGSCAVTLRSDLDAISMCFVLVHELGHLAGYAHTPEPGSPQDARANVMRPAPGRWDACDAARLAPEPRVVARRDAVALVRRRAPKRAVTCRRVRPDSFACTARRKGHRTIAFFVYDDGGVLRAERD